MPSAAVSSTGTGATFVIVVLTSTLASVLRPDTPAAMALFRLGSSLSNPSPIPRTMLTPITSRKSVDGEWIPRAAFTPSIRPFEKPAILSLIQSMAPLMPFQIPSTMFRPISWTFSGSEVMVSITPLTRLRAASLAELYRFEPQDTTLEIVCSNHAITRPGSSLNHSMTALIASMAAWRI